MAVFRAVLLLLCAIALAPGVARAQPDRLAELLAMPTAASLTGARDVPRFAWVENRSDVRNIWVADRGVSARAITRLDRDDGEDIYDLALSPDGSRIAYVRGGDGEWPDDAAPNAAGALIPVGRQLFVQSLDGDGTMQRIGEGNGPAFSPDGKRIAFANGREIWIWDGTARKIATVAGSVGRLGWSPDGARLLFLDDRRDHGFLGVLDIVPAQLRYVDTGPDYAAEPVFSPDGRQIAFVRYIDSPAGAPADGGPYWSLRIADAATGVTRTLWTAPKGMGGTFYGTRSKNLFWSADGQIIFPWERSGWIHPYAIDAVHGGTPRDLTPGDFEVETYLLDRAGRTLIYAANAGDIDRRHIWSRPLSGGPAVQLTSGTGIESYPTLGGDALAVLATDARTPARTMLVEKNRLAQLGPADSAFAATRDFVTPEQVVFKAEDGVTVHAQLFRGKGTGKRPALVFIHGGPRRQMLLGFIPSGYYSNTYIMNQHFAAQGYTVLSVNYRSGTGYGRAFRDAPEIARAGASEYRDILAAGRWLAAQNDVDRTRIGVWGGSWGGYLTALALARNSDLFAAGVDLHGVHTLLRAVPNNLSPDQQLAARQLQWDSSPMGAIERWRSPVLLVHGDDDRNVPFSQTVLLARELAARGIPHRAIAFPNERHSFLRYESWLTAFRAADAFFNRTIKQRAPLE